MSYLLSCVEVCKYININTVGCRSTIENKVCSTLLTTTSLSCCRYFSDWKISALYHPHVSDRAEPSMFLSNNSFSLSAPAKMFLIEVLDLPFFTLGRSVCEGKACLTLTTWLGHQVGATPFWFPKRVCVFMNNSVRIGPSMINCSQEQAKNIFFSAPVLWVFIVWNISFGNGVHWYLWSLNHQYLCIFYVLIFKKVKDQRIKGSWTLWFFCWSNWKCALKENQGSFTFHILPVYMHKTNAFIYKKNCFKATLYNFSTKKIIVLKSFLQSIYL